nr:sigma-54-dependent Fis family transcriptional regulator [Treponema sp.]
HIHVPPLRERKDDIPLLISHYLEKFAKDNHKEITGIDNRAKAAMYKYDWPGNIRELRNCIESAVVMASSSLISLEDLPPTISKSSNADTISVPVGITLDEAEKIIIQQNLAANKNNKSKTALILGIGRKTLARKLDDWSSGEKNEN